MTVLEDRIDNMTNSQSRAFNTVMSTKAKDTDFWLVLATGLMAHAWERRGMLDESVNCNNCKTDYLARGITDWTFKKDAKFEPTYYSFCSSQCHQKFYDTPSYPSTVKEEAIPEPITREELSEFIARLEHQLSL